MHSLAVVLAALAVLLSVGIPGAASSSSRLFPHLTYRIVSSDSREMRVWLTSSLSRAELLSSYRFNVSWENGGARRLGPAAGQHPSSFFTTKPGVTSTVPEEQADETKGEMEDEQASENKTGGSPTRLRRSHRSNARGLLSMASSDPSSLSDANSGCYTLKTEEECMVSRDGRKDKPGITDSPCDWCCGAPCRSNSGNTCEPHAYLVSGHADVKTWTGNSKNCVGDDTCDEPGTSALCPPPPEVYSWAVGAFGECSKTCSGGAKARDVECTDSKDVVAADAACGKIAGGKPETTEPCNIGIACLTIFRWHTTAYGTCSKSCGGGVHHRAVTCQSSNATAAPPPDAKKCVLAAEKPSESKACNTWACPPERPIGSGPSLDVTVHALGAGDKYGVGVALTLSGVTHHTAGTTATAVIRTTVDMVDDGVGATSRRRRLVFEDKISFVFVNATAGALARSLLWDGAARDVDLLSRARKDSIDTAPQISIAPVNSPKQQPADVFAFIGGNDATDIGRDGNPLEDTNHIVGAVVNVGLGRITIVPSGAFGFKKLPEKARAKDQTRHNNKDVSRLVNLLELATDRSPYLRMEDLQRFGGDRMWIETSTSIYSKKDKTCGIGCKGMNPNWRLAVHSSMVSPTVGTMVGRSLHLDPSRNPLVIIRSLETADVDRVLEFMEAGGSVLCLGNTLGNPSLEQRDGSAELIRRASGGRAAMDILGAPAVTTQLAKKSPVTVSFDGMQTIAALLLDAGYSKVPRAPVARSETIHAYQGLNYDRASPFTTSGTFGASDVNPGDESSLLFVVVTPPAHGSVDTSAGNGKWTYTALMDVSSVCHAKEGCEKRWYGSDSFTFRVTDRSGLSSLGAVAISEDYAPTRASDSRVGESTYSDDSVACPAGAGGGGGASDAVIHDVFFGDGLLFRLWDADTKTREARYQHNAANRVALLKIHVTSATRGAAPPVKVVFSVGGAVVGEACVKGPASLPTAAEMPSKRTLNFPPNKQDQPDVCGLEGNVACRMESDCCHDKTHSKAFTLHVNPAWIRPGMGFKITAGTAAPYETTSLRVFPEQTPVVQVTNNMMAGERNTLGFDAFIYPQEFHDIFFPASKIRFASLTKNTDFFSAGGGIGWNTVLSRGGGYTGIAKLMATGLAAATAATKEGVQMSVSNPGSGTNTGGPLGMGGFATCFGNLGTCVHELNHGWGIGHSSTGRSLPWPMGEHGCSNNCGYSFALSGGVGPSWGYDLSRKIYVSNLSVEGQAMLRMKTKAERDAASIYTRYYDKFKAYTPHSKSQPFAVWKSSQADAYRNDPDSVFAPMKNSCMGGSAREVGFIGPAAEIDKNRLSIAFRLIRAQFKWDPSLSPFGWVTWDYPTCSGKGCCKVCDKYNNGRVASHNNKGPNCWDTLGKRGTPGGSTNAAKPDCWFVVDGLNGDMQNDGKDRCMTGPACATHGAWKPVYATEKDVPAGADVLRHGVPIYAARLAVDFGSDGSVIKGTKSVSFIGNQPLYMPHSTVLKTYDPVNARGRQRLTSKTAFGVRWVQTTTTEIDAAAAASASATAAPAVGSLGGGAGRLDVRFALIQHASAATKTGSKASQLYATIEALAGGKLVSVDLYTVDVNTTGVVDWAKRSFVSRYTNPESVWGPALLGKSGMNADLSAVRGDLFFATGILADRSVPHRQLHAAAMTPDAVHWVSSDPTIIAHDGTLASTPGVGQGPRLVTLTATEVSGGAVQHSTSVLVQVHENGAKTSPAVKCEGGAMMEVSVAKNSQVVVPFGVWDCVPVPHRVTLSSISPASATAITASLVEQPGFEAPFTTLAIRASPTAVPGSQHVVEGVVPGAPSGGGARTGGTVRWRVTITEEAIPLPPTTGAPPTPVAVTTGTGTTGTTTGTTTGSATTGVTSSTTTGTTTGNSVTTTGGTTAIGTTTGTRTSKDTAISVLAGVGEAVGWYVAVPILCFIAVSILCFILNKKKKKEGEGCGPQTNPALQLSPMADMANSSVPQSPVGRSSDQTSEFARALSGTSLPPGWEEHVDPTSGELYFHHAEAGKTQWERPSG